MAKILSKITVSVFRTRNSAVDYVGVVAVAAVVVFVFAAAVVVLLLLLLLLLLAVLLWIYHNILGSHGQSKYFVVGW